MGKDNANPAPSSKGFIEYAEFVLKVLGAGTLLTALMGWPAVSMHFQSFGIPANLVSTEAAIRAGIQPALAFMVIFGYFWFVLRACQNLPSLSHDARATPIFLFHVVPLAAVALLIRLGAFICGVFVALWWLLDKLDLVVAPEGAIFWWTIFVSIPIGIGLVLATLAIFNRLTQRKFSEGDETGVTWFTSMYFYLLEYIELAKNFVALYFIYFFILIVFPDYAHWLSLPIILVTSVFLGLAAMMVGVGVAVLKGASDLAIGNLRQSFGFVSLAALLTVWMYSTDIYPILPKSLGGGKPDVAELWIDKSKAPALAGWHQAKSIDSQYHLGAGHLLYLDNKIVVITERANPPAKWVTLSRDAVVAIAGSGTPQ